jgi:hypothetical protein
VKKYLDMVDNVAISLVDVVELFEPRNLQEKDADAVYDKLLAIGRFLDGAAKGAAGGGGAWSPMLSANYDPTPVGPRKFSFSITLMGALNLTWKGIPVSISVGLSMLVVPSSQHGKGDKKAELTFVVGPSIAFPFQSSKTFKASVGATIAVGFMWNDPNYDLVENPEQGAGLSLGASGSWDKTAKGMWWSSPYLTSKGGGLDLYFGAPTDKAALNDPKSYIPTGIGLHADASGLFKKMRLQPRVTTRNLSSYLDPTTGTDKLGGSINIGFSFVTPLWTKRW